MFKYFLLTMLIVSNIVVAKDLDKTDIKKHLHWISNNTEFTETNKIPENEYPLFITLTDDAFTSQYGKDAQAAYSLVDKNIYLRSSLEGESKNSVIVHELYHYLQDRYKVKYACSNAMERGAYQAQFKYMEEHNIPINSDKVMILLLTMCITRNAWEK